MYLSFFKLRTLRKGSIFNLIQFFMHTPTLVRTWLMRKNTFIRPCTITHTVVAFQKFWFILNTANHNNKLNYAAAATETSCLTAGFAVILTSSAPAAAHLPRDKAGVKVKRALSIKFTLPSLWIA